MYNSTIDTPIIVLYTLPNNNIMMNTKAHPVISQKKVSAPLSIPPNRGVGN
jgi:hypothetical protein